MPTIKQLVELKLPTLEKRITKAYEQDHNAQAVICQARILQIRGNLTNEGIEHPLKKLIRHIFKGKLRRQILGNLYYFQTYFSADEWQVILQRMARAGFIAPFFAILIRLFSGLTWLLIVFFPRLVSQVKKVFGNGLTKGRRTATLRVRNWLFASYQITVKKGYTYDERNKDPCVFGKRKIGCFFYRKTR